MSQIYVNEPATNGKVLMHTTLGDIDIELWAKETPKTCRNFIQLCLEGYYDNTIFHRVVKGFMAQGGDPTGTGHGGESIYGEDFENEIHQRLRFTHRGLVAMANSGPGTNASQFFFTLDACDWLNGRHTIFAKITGDTIFNALRLGEVETDGDDRPNHPPRIISTDVLHNPFDDIVPREKEKEKEVKEEASTKKKVKKKNLKLLSFGEEAEAEDSIAPLVKTKIKSSHDVATSDSKLSAEAVEIDMEKVERERKRQKSLKDDEKKKNDLKEAVARAKEASTNDSAQSFAEEMKSKLLKARGDVSLEAKKEREARERQEEIASLQKELNQKKENKKAAEEAEKKKSEKKSHLDELASKYKKRSARGKGSEAKTLEKLKMFKSTLRNSDQDKADGIFDHTLTFERHAGDRFGTDDYITIDPLEAKGGEKRKRDERSKHQRSLDRNAKKLERW